MSIAETLVLDDVISIVVLADMELRLSTQYVAREGDHNSAVFRIVRQPAALDSLVCRAEIETAQGKNYYLVDDNGEFALTQDIAVAGPGRLQLVYSDGVEVMRKTSIAHFTVMPSINAVDPGDPDFQDGLAQMQANAFTNVIGSDTTATFYNLNGNPVAVLVYPPGQGGGLDEATANQLYLRLNGTNIMSGDMRMVSDQGIDGPIGIVLGGRQAKVRWENALILTRGQAGEPVQIENNNGTQRSDIITQLMGDARYAQLTGAQFSGPLITQMGTGLTNPGIGIGDNSTGFYRAGGSLLLSVSGQLYAQYLASPPSLMSVVPINMATQAITNLADAVGPQDAANRRTVESIVNTAVAAAPKPNSRTYIPEGVEIPTGASSIQFITQPFPVADNATRTVVITLFPAYTGGTPGAFYDLVYTCGLIPGVEARSAVYGTTNAYMQSPIRFAATVTPSGNSIQVTLNVREISNNPNRLSQVGITADRRSYVTIEEQQN